MNTNFKIIKSKDGYDILNINLDKRDFNIGSKYNEGREIKKFIDSIGHITEYDNYVVLGLGCGNHIKELLKNKYETSKILVVECNEEWIEKFNDMGICSNIDVTITSNLDDVKQFMKGNISNGNVNYLKVLAYGGYEKQFLKEVTPYFKIIKDFSTELKINNNTLNAFEDLWYKYKIRNLKYLLESRSLISYKDKYKDKPAIIVSAGPSLEKNINMLKEKKDVVIISGGRTLKSLLNIGVDPDFLSIVDAGEPSLQLVDEYIGDTNSTLTYYYGVPTKILEKHNADKIVFDENKAIESVLGEKIIDISGGGSVAHAMTNLAIVLGCNPIIFIGQDLAFTNDKEHAQIASSPWKQHDVSIASNEKNDDIYVKDINGGLVRTTITLNLFRKQLENIIRNNKGNRFINATEGGADIDGTEVMLLNEIYSTFNEKIDEINKIENEKKCSEKIAKLLIDNKASMLKSIELYKEAININEDYIKCVKLNISNTSGIEKRLASIEKKIIKNNKNILFIETLVNKILYILKNNNEYLIVKGDSDKEALLKVLMKSRYIFISICEKLVQSLEIIEQELECIKEGEL